MRAPTRSVTGCLTIALEDGFLRSKGHGGAEPPLSLVLDDIGIYYDANRPSRLEALVREAAEDASALARGVALAAAWRAGRVSKYNHQPDVAPEAEGGFALVIDQNSGRRLSHPRACRRGEFLAYAWKRRSTRIRTAPCW